MSLDEEDAKAIASQLEGAVAVAPSVRGGAQLTAEGANWQTRVEGVTPDGGYARGIWNWSARGAVTEELQDLQKMRSANMDAIAKAVTLAKADTATPSDALAKGLFLVETDSAAATDLIVKALGT